MWKKPTPSEGNIPHEPAMVLFCLLRSSLVTYIAAKGLRFLYGGTVAGARCPLQNRSPPAAARSHRLPRPLPLHRRARPEARSGLLLHHLPMEQAARPLLPPRPARPRPQAVRRDAPAGRRLLQHTLIARLSHSAAERARAYSRMLSEDRGGVRPDGTTLSALLAPPCAGGFVLQVHAHAVRFGLRSTAFVGTALVRAYGLCGRADAVAAAFEEIAEPDAVCWNVMVDACARHGGPRRALEMLSRMRRAGGVADGFTLASVLKACACEEDLGLGTQLHACACKVGSDSETATCNALITMYLKCGGGMCSAVEVFDGISEPNMITWTALIAGLAQNGLAAEAVSFYKEMVKTGERENGHCFASVLSASGALASLEHGKMVHCRQGRSLVKAKLGHGPAKVFALLPLPML